MKIRKIKGISGFIGTTYAVYDGAKIVKIFTTKQEAEQFVKENNK